MEDLTGSDHQIKLTIREGRNFENVVYPTIIVASLNNQSLETDLVQPDNNPQYLTDLFWEVEKKVLRIMRSGQTPLKIECYALNEDGAREKLGYVLLSVRTAQIIPKNDEVDIRFNWHPLLGLKGDLKSSKPELLLSLVIEDLSNNAAIQNNPSSIQTITPVLLEHEHLIQLGPIDSCHDLFLITIMAGIVNNLDVLISESTLKEQMADVSFWFRIMDNDIRLNPFNKTWEKQCILNEKIVIRIRSSLTVLKSYFQIQPYLLIFLKFKDNAVAQSKLDVRPLIFTDCLNEFVKKTQNASTSLEQQCILLKDGEVCNAHEPKASISIKFKVQYVDKKSEQTQFPKIPPSNASTKSSSVNGHRTKEIKSTRTNVDSHMNCAGDCESSTRRTPLDLNSLQSKSQFTRPQNIARDYKESQIASFHCYCLNVYLTGMKLFATCPLIRNIEFRFHHPKAEIMSTLHPAVPVMSEGKLSLQNVGCKLNFISSADEIKNLLVSYPPRISVCDDTANAKICVAQTLLEVKKLFNQHVPECQYEAVLADADGTHIGTLDIIMNLEDHGPYYNDRHMNSGDNLGPPILDDSLVYKIVDELEAWKDKQKEMFKIELKNKEEHYLNVLGEEWRKKKEVLEAKLANSVEQCKMLASSLNNATEDLRIRRLKSHEKETRLLKTNEELQKRYDMMILDLRSSADKMQYDFAAKLNSYEECKHSYETQIDALKRENEMLQRKLKQYEEQFEEEDKLGLSQEQVTSLLQEVKMLQKKLAIAQENSNYYRDQWHLMHAEMEKMKIEMKSSREEYRRFEYEDILSANTEALMNDQKLIDQLQRKLETIEPKSTRITTSSDPAYAPLNSLLSNPSQNSHRHDPPSKDEEHEAKLKELIERRDELLKTGSYLNDEPIIVTMNNEIRALLSSKN